MLKPKASIKEIVFSATFFLLIFQNPLEGVSSAFKYLDELAAAAGLALLLLNYKTTYELFHTKTGLIILTGLTVFVCSGLLGNILFRYQNLKLVVIDIITNVKFFLIMALGYFFADEYEEPAIKRNIVFIAKAATVFLVVLFLADRILNIYDSDIRYGIKSAKLFFGHPTYFSGALVAIIAYLSAFYEKKNIYYIAADLLMIVYTLRFKAFASVFVFVFLWWCILIREKELKAKDLCIAGVASLAIAFKQFYYYFFELNSKSARSLMLTTSFKIMRDYFPIGTGFGTYASHSAAVNYSPVYTKYGFEETFELRNASEGTFFDDQFWPIIFGQTGIIGTLAYLSVITLIFIKCWNLKNGKKQYYLAALFAFIYIIISSSAEPAFNNSISALLAILLGWIFKQSDDGANDVLNNVSIYAHYRK